MEGEQLYIFVDKSGHCFEDFQKKGNVENGQRDYNALIGAWLVCGRKFCVGDMLAFRDDLTAEGFKWGEDFYAKKEPK